MTINEDRRIFLKSSLAAGMVSSAIGLGLMTPRAVLAAWNEKAFSTDSVDMAVEKVLGGAASTASDDIEIDAPEVAENGAMVPITWKTKLTGVDSIALLAENNARPLCCVYRPSTRARPGVSIRIKMGKSGDVIAVVRSDGKLYSSRRSVKVTAGGC